MLIKKKVSCDNALVANEKNVLYLLNTSYYLI